MIVQHQNGNSYLFVDDRVFVSSCNVITGCVTTCELDLSSPIALSKWELEQIKTHIGEIFPDGFKYWVAIHSFGNHNLFKHDTLKKAQDQANHFYEDNGFAHMFTDNPDVDIALSGGYVFYLTNFESLSHPFYAPKEAKKICESLNEKQRDEDVYDEY